MNPTLKGSLKSKTMWAAALFGVLSEVLPLLTPDMLLSIGFDPPTVKRLGLLVSIVMIALRKATTQSLAEKGSDPVLPPPAQ
jgi:hypothetical protein